MNWLEKIAEKQIKEAGFQEKVRNYLLTFLLGTGAGAYVALPSDTPKTSEKPRQETSVHLPDNKNLPRGIRNNNPGNIEKGQNWKNSIEGKDDRFLTFKTPEDGIRAMSRLLRNYQRMYGLSTLEQIINRYAPHSENPTDTYVSKVAERAGVNPNKNIDLEDDQIMFRVIKAMISFENGFKDYYPDKTILEGIKAERS